MIENYVTRNDEGYTLSVDVRSKGYTVRGANVLEVGMWAAADASEGDGDMYVLWDTTGLENMDTVMGAFYWDNEFNDTLRGVLRDCGFSDAACMGVAGSEWGMQDEGRASYDAYSIANEVRAAMTQ